MATFNAEPAQMDRLTVLAAGGKTETAFQDRTNWTLGGDSIQASNDIKKIRPAGGKETLRAGLALREGENRFNLYHSAGYIARFGGEHAGNLGNMNPEEKASYLKATDLIRQNTKISLFLEARGLPPNQRNQRIVDVLSQNGMANMSYDALRKEALQSIANNPSFISMFPEIQANFGTPGAPYGDGVLKFIENTLVPADDHRLSARMGTRLQETYKKAVGFESVMTDEKKAELEEQKRVGEAESKQNIKKITGLLTSRGMTKPGGGNITEADVKTWIDTIAFTPDTTGDAIASQVLGVSLESIGDMRRYTIDLPQQRAKLESIINAKSGGMSLANYRTAHPGESEVMSLDQLDAQYALLDVQYGVGHPKAGDLANFNASGIGALYLDGSLQSLGSSAKKSADSIDKLTAQISARPVKLVDIEQSRDKRLLQEEDLLGEIEGILGQSIADVLEERYDVLEEKMGRMMQEKADKTEKDIKINIMELKRKMSTNWIEYNASTRKKNVKKDAIKRDVTHLAYHFDKEVALKQLIARDLFGLSGSKFEKLNIIDGTNMSSKTVPPEQLLTSDQLKQVEGVFKEVGGEYRDKLFADMFAARGFTDRTFNLGFGVEATWGKLGFKRDEWKYMLQRYEPDITKALEANQETSAALKSLEAQGVKIDINMKWLWYLLAIVFGGTAGMVAAGGPAAILGVKAGLAANSVGAGLAAGAATEAVGGVAGASAVSLGTRAAMNGFSEN